MRSVLVFPAGDRAKTVATLDQHLPQQRDPCTAEVHRLVALLLEHGGVAVDDYSARLWTLQEIKSGTVIDGLGFFDFRTYHERHRGH